MDIHDNALDHESLDHSVSIFLHGWWRRRRQSVQSEANKANNEKNDVFSSLSTNLKGSASRLTRSARRGDTGAILKVAGICIAVGIVLWLLLKWIF